MLKHKRSALSIALAVAMAPTLAAAQSATPASTTDTEQAAGAVTDLDKVQVTGLRRAIEGAISVKRDSTSIVEAISAEDIGRLPDVSIAESLARLPGLAAQRVAGRAQVISVRGLSPDFSTTLLNGREVVSTGDNRSVEFDQYPSELVSGVTVGALQRDRVHHATAPQPLQIAHWRFLTTGQERTAPQQSRRGIDSSAISRSEYVCSARLHPGAVSTIRRSRNVRRGARCNASRRLPDRKIKEQHVPGRGKC